MCLYITVLSPKTVKNQRFIHYVFKLQTKFFKKNANLKCWSSATIEKFDVQNKSQLKGLPYLTNCWNQIFSSRPAVAAYIIKSLKHKLNSLKTPVTAAFTGLRIQIPVHSNESQMMTRAAFIICEQATEHWPIRRPAWRHAMTAANTVARSFGLVFLVRKPKIDEPAPVPMPEKKK